MKLTEEHLSNLGFRLGMTYWVYSKSYIRGGNQIKISVRIKPANKGWIMYAYGETEVKGAEIESVEDISEVLDLLPEFKSMSMRVKSYISNHKEVC